MRSRPIRLLTDADGVLVDFNGGALDVYARLTGNYVDPQSLTEWEFTSSLKFDNEGMRDLFWRHLNEEGFCKNLKPLPGAVEAIKKLRDMQVDVHVVTSPMKTCPTWTHEREFWIAKHLNLPRTRIHHSAFKAVYSGDLFIDDKPEHVMEWSDYNPGGAAFLWNAPGNRNAKGLNRLHSWDELFGLIEARQGRSIAR